MRQRATQRTPSRGVAGVLQRQESERTEAKCIRTKASGSYEFTSFYKREESERVGAAAARKVLREIQQPATGQERCAACRNSGGRGLFRGFGASVPRSGRAS